MSITPYSTRSLLAVLALTSVSASAAPLTYDVNLSFGAAKAVGFLTTDGHLGGLNASNILDWEFALTAGGQTRTIRSLGTPAAPLVSLFQNFGAPLYASPTELTVGNGADSGSFIFENSNQDFTIDYRFFVNPIVNSQLNTVQLSVFLSEPNFYAPVLTFDTAPGTRFGALHVSTDVPAPPTAWLLASAILACGAITGRQKRGGA